LKTPGILIIDDDPDIVDALRVLLEDDFRVETETRTNRIVSLAAGPYDLISAGVNTGNEGLFWLSKILAINPGACVILMTAYGNISLAVEAIKRGARDFILKPWDNDKLIATLRASLGQQKVKTGNAPGAGRTSPVYVEGRSPVMLRLQEQLRKVAATDASVLLLGENGTGKEVIARELHRLSSRAGCTFLSVDLSALSSTLFESELFGHKKGAYTDAHSDRTGRFREAHGGTLFLDEIGDLPHAQQVKLLTVLQTREVIPVGSDERIPVDVRLISATSVSGQQLGEPGHFRQDLLYRINTITIHVPPLRERGEDILMLAEYFLDHYCKQYGKELPELTAEARHALQVYAWPGNVRELQHTLEKAVILCDGMRITRDDLNLSISSKLPDAATPPTMTLDHIEKEALRQALITHGGNIVQASKALGITRQTLYNKMKKYGL
jgi:two-component system, NtrC family, response regulator HydG